MSINIESSYSFNGSLIKEDSLESFKDLGHKALGLVDNNSAFFLVFYNKMISFGIKPILGLRVKGKLYDYILYPRNFKGYQDILFYASNKDAQDIKDIDSIPKNSDLIYCFDVSMMSTDNIDQFLTEYERMKNEGSEVYAGLDFSYYPCEVDLYPKIKDKVDGIILNKVKYLSKDDKLASDTLLSILTDTPLPEDNLFNMERAVLHYLPSYDALKVQYKDYPDLLDNYNKLIDEVDIKMEFERRFPQYPTKDNIPSDIYLKALAKKGLTKRLLNTTKDPKVYKERLNYELDVIHKMGFDDYFLVVYDYILYAKKNGIYVGPGRGSAASSLVSYSLGIVDIDPLEYNLYFERFLNPSRKTMPDIDTDFEDTRRDDVIKYVSMKYGPYHTALISTFQTFLAKSAIRDVSKVLDINPLKIDMISKEITNDNSLSSLLSKKTIKNYYDKDMEYHKLLDVSMKIEGLPRQVGTHAAGVIISDKDLRYYSEVHIGLNDFLQTTYDSDSLKDVGLLKMDFLALKNLTVIHDIVNDIEENEKTKIDLNKIDLKDPLTFKLLREKSTIGIFQLESPGMSDLLKKMKVNNFLDLSLVIALYRPGPMENIPSYLRRREGKEKINYYDDSIKDVLEETLGIIVYQEQIMAIANKYAGLSLADADILRRAISSKDSSLILALKDQFFKGADKMNRKLLVTEKLFNDIFKFAGYGFNKSHSVSYSKVAYSLAYLKAHYPKEFMANLLKNSSSPKYIKECQSLRIKVLPPDLRYSSYKYMVNKDGIYMPYTEIKGIGVAYAKEIEEIAKSSNLTFEGFISKAKDNLPRGLIEELILSGTFDYTNHNKRTMIEALDGLYDFDPTLIKGLNYKIKIKDEYDFDYLKNREFELLGFNPKYHPLKAYKGSLETISDLTLGNDFAHIVGYVTGIRELKTKAGDRMVSLFVEDEFLSVKAVIFPKDYVKAYHILKENEIYELFGSYKENKGEPQFVIRTMNLINKPKGDNS